jgi:hypothetical protein
LVTYYARIHERDLPANVAAGWTEVGRDYVPSLFADVVLLEWVGEEPPAVERSL